MFKVRKVLLQCKISCLIYETRFLREKEENHGSIFHRESLLTEAKFFCMDQLLDNFVPHP